MEKYYDLISWIVLLGIMLSVTTVAILLLWVTLTDDDNPPKKSAGDLLIELKQK